MKKTYKSPKLKVIGTLTQLTKVDPGQGPRVSGARRPTSQRFA